MKAKPLPDNAGIDFIRQIILEDNQTQKWNGRVETRFPPEPNGYLHIGHAKSICLNFGLAESFNGVCHLRFDDTNPEKEDEEYVEAIKSAIRWLGFDWHGHVYYASDYFDQLYAYAETLIEKGLAYVDSLSSDDIRKYRGTLTEPGRNSPYRDRSVKENLDLFRRMKAGEFPDGAHVLRAKIDMASPNINMRDPILYRIRHVPHYRAGNAWCIYPMYDYTHCLSDAMENITHSICTLEFEDHRPLYDWILDQLEMPVHPQQIEFARLNLTYAVTSKRKLLQLIQDGVVSGWDDPRLSTLMGMRRRGYQPAAIRDFCARIGVTKSDGWVEMSYFEECQRTYLNETALRRIAILNPLKVVIDNFPEDRTEACAAPNHPQKPELGERTLYLTKTIYIDRSDFEPVPTPGFFRLMPGTEVRLRYAYIIRCVRMELDENGNIVELGCTYDPETKSGMAGNRKIKGNIHWLSDQDARPAEVRLYDNLFLNPKPDAGTEDFKACLNPDSLKVVSQALVEPALVEAEPGEIFQFERTGYFVADLRDHVKGEGQPVFNRTVTLKDGSKVKK